MEEEAPRQCVKEVPLQAKSQVYDAEEIDSLKKQYPDGLKYKLEPYVALEADEKRLDGADLVEEDKAAREKANYFTCAICTMVVLEPMECRGCESQFCKECIQPWLAKNQHCPKKCKGNDAVEFGGMHRFVKQELE